MNQPPVQPLLTHPLKPPGPAPHSQEAIGLALSPDQPVSRNIHLPTLR